MIETMKSHAGPCMLTMQRHPERHAGPDAQAMQDNPTAMGQAFDDAKNDDSFYLPPEVFDNPDFKRGMKMFMSPDGKAARFIITHEGDPAYARGHLAHRRDQERRVRGASRARRWRAPRSTSAGTAATYKDMQDGANYDLMIAGIAALSLIFIIMLIITRSVVAAVVIVGTVVLSLGASFGLSVLIWQHIFGIDAALDGAGDGGHHPAGGGRRTTTCCWCPGSRRRSTPASTPASSGRWRGTGSVVTVGRSGVRLHHGVDDLQRPDGARPGRHDDRPRSAVRHPDRAVVHDAVDRGAARAAGSGGRRWCGSGRLPRRGPLPTVLPLLTATAFPPTRSARSPAHIRTKKYPARATARAGYLTSR